MSKNTTIDLIKQQLGSIDLSDVQDLEEQKLSDAELKARSHDVEIFYDKYFDDVIKLFIWKQLRFIGENAEDYNQVNFSRGTINGLYLIRSWFKKQKRSSRARFDKDTDTGVEPFETT